MLAIQSINIVAWLCTPQVTQLLIDNVIGPAFGAAPIVPDSNFFYSFIANIPATDLWSVFLRLVTAYCLLMLSKYVGHYARWTLSSIYGLKAEKILRGAVYRKMLAVDALTLSKFPSGEMMTIQNSDAPTVKRFFFVILASLFDQVLAMCVAIYFLSLISWKLVLIPVLMGLIASLVSVIYMKIIRKRYQAIRDASADLNTCVQENINGVRIIRAYASESIEIDKFKKKNNRLLDTFFAETRTQSLFNAIYTALGPVLVQLGSVIFGAVLALRGIMTIGQFAVFISYVSIANQQIINISRNLAQAQRAKVSSDRLFGFIDTESKIKEPTNPVIITEKPSVEVKNVSVALEGHQILDDVSLSLPYGKKLGIMGRTGSGKTVLLKILAHTIEADSGSVEINGINIRNMTTDDCMRNYSIVYQDVFLFSNTVDSNIALYDLDAPKEKVERAAELTECDRFIRELDDGYNTIIGERGIGLSGGQKQRLSIARAILKDAPIIMFDDCTSALDLETERRILGNIERSLSNKTVVIVSHRASSVEACDEIIFMEDGKIVERGTHLELMKLKGKYHDVYMKQSASAEEKIGG